FYTCQFANGDTWAQFYRADEGYLIRFPELADFWISREGTNIEAHPCPDTPLDTVEHLYLNQVLPLALSRQFRLVLHGSAVAIGEGAVSFLGEAGRGKSTLAANFATAGYPFISDDALDLRVGGGQVQVLPGHPSLRLWEDSRAALLGEVANDAIRTIYSPKGRYLASRDIPHHTQSTVLTHVFFLAPETSGEVSIVRLTPRQAVVEM